MKITKVILSVFIITFIAVFGYFSSVDTNIKQTETIIKIKMDKS